MSPKYLYKPGVRLSRVVARAMSRMADNRGSIIRNLGLSREEAERFHRRYANLSFSMARWWLESGIPHSYQFMDAPFAQWIEDNPGVAGNWRKLSYKQAKAKFEQIILRDPEKSGNLILTLKGWKWIQYPRNAFGESKCPVWVSDYLGHCGKAEQGAMVVLFDPRGRPHVTATLSKDYLFDLVGVGHSGVKKRYQGFIEDLVSKQVSQSVENFSIL